ncbi:MAG: hypothetical protein KGI54_17095, partial [Pseudomonadota bacterium]|nr:hypothetical protein [Pseudomonadota bacterium]
MANLKEVKPFDPNEGAADLATPWPTLDHVYSAADYVSAIMPETPSTMGFIAKSVNEAVVIAKATDLPPSMTSFTTMTLMPEVHNGGVLQPPGIPFESLRKVVRDNVAPQMIINQRVADVQRYANLSSHPWKPGWKIELRHGLKNPSTSESQDIRDAQVFLQNCNSEYGDNARKRDARQLTNFSSFLTQIVWDTFTYDGISIWTDTDLKGRIKAFKALSTFNIRLTTKEGWQGNPNIFAIGLDEAGNPIATFTRDELVFVVRNARADADIHGYGLSEVEQAIKSIQGISNAMDTAVDKFNKNAVPNGILTAEGMWTSRQLDVLTR